MGFRKWWGEYCYAYLSEKSNAERESMFEVAKEAWTQAVTETASGRKQEMVMNDELRPCPRPCPACDGTPIVDQNGGKCWCKNTHCVGWANVFQVEDWNALPRRGEATCKQSLQVDAELKRCPTCRSEYNLCGACMPINRQMMRFEAACAALSGLCPAKKWGDECLSNGPVFRIVTDAISIADAMLAELEKPR